MNHPCTPKKTLVHVGLLQVLEASLPRAKTVLPQGEIMTWIKLTSRFLVFPLFIVASLVLGWLIPGFYEWTGSDQSRPSPLIWQFALGMIIGGFILCLLLPFLPAQTAAEDETREPKMRFTVKNLIVLTGVIAIIVVALMKFPLVTSCVLCGGAFLHYVWFIVLHPKLRLPAAALLSCMCLPFVWLVGYGEFSNIWKGLVWIATGLPMLLPSAYLASWFGLNFHTAP